MPRFRGLVLVHVVALAAACQADQSQQALTDSMRAQVSAQIRAAADSAIAGFNRRDPTVYLNQASTIRTYAENTTVYPDADSLARTVRALTSTVRSLDITLSGEPVIVVLTPDIGVYSSRFHQALTDSAGTTYTMNGVWSVVYQRMDGAWKIVAGHESYGPADTSEGT